MLDEDIIVKTGVEHAECAQTLAGFILGHLGWVGGEGEGGLTFVLCTHVHMPQA